MDFVKAEGTRFTVAGAPIFFRGIGVGSWLNLEHYELGVPGWESDIFRAVETVIPDFEEQYRRCFFTDEDAAYLRSLGINLIRVPLNHRLFWDEGTDDFSPVGPRWLKTLSDICRKAGLYYLPDLHTAPGGQNPDWHSECRTGRAEFWHYAVFRKRTAQIWHRIAECLREDPMVLGYDLLNEPMLQEGDAEALNRFYTETAAEIRKADPHHLIFLEGDHFAMDYRGLRLSDDPQTAFTFHFYPSVWNPEISEMADAQREEALLDSLGRILGSMEGAPRPLLCGETGFELNPQDPEKWFRLSGQVLRALEESGAGWCLWNYKDTGTIGLTSPAPGTPWMALARDVGEKWNHHRAEAIGYEAADRAGAASGYPLTAEERYRLQFMIRAGLAKSDVRHVLLPALGRIPPADRGRLAESFRLDRCEIHRPMERLLQQFCQAGAPGP